MTKNMKIFATIGGVLAGLFVAKRIGNDSSGSVLPDNHSDPIPMPPIEFIEAEKFGIGRQGHSVKWVVIHTAETGETGTAAEGVAAFFQHGAPGTSAHYTVDNNSIVQSVKEENTAWHAKGINYDSIGIEHAGRAKQTTDEWGDAYSLAELELSAKLCAGICSRFGIPARHVTATEILTGESGITGHDSVNKAFKQGDHIDPGESFPWDYYINLVNQNMGVA